MHTYNLVLFMHIAAVLALFSASVLRFAVLAAAGRARTVAVVRVLTTLAVISDKVMPVASLATLGSGIWMVRDMWTWDIAWIRVALDAVLAMLVLGPLVNSRLLNRMHRAAQAAPNGPVPASLARMIHDPVLHLSENTMFMAGMGVLYLMATKPGMEESIRAVVGAAAAGAALTVLSLMLAGRGRASVDEQLAPGSVLTTAEG